MKTELVFVLDRSGSMSGLERDTIGGFNSLLEKQKKDILKSIARIISRIQVRDLIHTFGFLQQERAAQEIRFTRHRSDVYVAGNRSVANTAQLFLDRIHALRVFPDPLRNIRRVQQLRQALAHNG